jgi:hypothetical protein
VGLFIEMFKKAFDKDSQIHLGKNGWPDGYEDGSFLRQWYLKNNGGAFSIYKNNVPIGGINVFVNIQKKKAF